MASSVRKRALLLALLASGCDIFLSDIGGLNEPCANSGRCDDGLVCNFDECVEPLAQGEECDMTWIEDGLVFENNWEEWLDSYDVCEEGLCCQAGSCGPDTPTVQQPGTEIAWQRCPAGVTWDHCLCLGMPGDFNDDDMNDSSVCPTGSRLPTRAEAISLLGNCDADVQSGSAGFCDGCVATPGCADILAFLDGPLCEYAHFWALTSSTAGGSPEDPAYWVVDLCSGEVFTLELSFLGVTAICVEDL